MLTLVNEEEKVKERSQEKEKMVMVSLCSSMEPGANDNEDEPRTIRVKEDVACCYTQYWPGKPTEERGSEVKEGKGKGKS